MTASRLPAAFLGHGSPLNALEQNDYTRAWQGFGAAAPRPRALLVVSAHWYINATAIAVMAWPRTIHDFYEFPEALFAIPYPAPGDPLLAEEIADFVKPTWVGLDRDAWGIDHGTWWVLVHAFSRAEIAVLHLAINARKPFEYHFELGARLAARERGILILGSGNVVHNLHQPDWGSEHVGFDWARRFDEAARDRMTTAPAEIAALADHRDYRHAVPTPDHFIPLLYIAGLAAAANSTANVLLAGYAYGSLSMTAYTLDCPCPERMRAASAPAALPDPESVPPEATNIGGNGRADG